MACSSGTVRTSSPTKEVYDPRAFFPHAASLGQAFAHCPRFLAAASRRSRGRVSVPFWLVVLSDQLPVFGLVSRYLTNNLIGRGPLRWRPSKKDFLPRGFHPGNLRGISSPFGKLSPATGQVTHAILSRPPLSDKVGPFDLHA